MVERCCLLYALLMVVGVRYAKAPVGPLRFQKPERVDSWEGVVDATTLGSVCPQIQMPLEGKWNVF